VDSALNDVNHAVPGCAESEVLEMSHFSIPDKSLHDYDGLWYSLNIASSIPMPLHGFRYERCENMWFLVVQN
jgi:hypothetical protein